MRQNFLYKPFLFQACHVRPSMSLFRLWYFYSLRVIDNSWLLLLLLQWGSENLLFQIQKHSKSDFFKIGFYADNPKISTFYDVRGCQALGQSSTGCRFGREQLRYLHLLLHLTQVNIDLTTLTQVLISNQSLLT